MNPKTGAGIAMLLRTYRARFFTSARGSGASKYSSHFLRVIDLTTGVEVHRARIHD
jgi:hypothetical protein